MYLPFASLMPVFLAEDTPPFSLSKNLTKEYCSLRRLHISPLPSLEPSLTKMTSSWDFLIVCFVRLLAQRSRCSAQFYTGMTTDTLY